MTSVLLRRHGGRRRFAALGARLSRERERLHPPCLTLALELAEMDQDVLHRALDLQAQLAERSQHRGVPLPDLMIAATADRHDLVVLHHNAHFEQIAAVSGQATEWVVERGSVP